MKEDDDAKVEKPAMGEVIKLLRNSVPRSQVSQRSASVRPLPAGRSYSGHRAKFVLFLPARWCEKWEERSDEKARRDETELGVLVFTFCSLMRWSNFCREIYMIRDRSAQSTVSSGDYTQDLDSPPIDQLLFGILSQRLALLPAFDSGCCSNSTAVQSSF